MAIVNIQTLNTGGVAPQSIINDLFAPTQNQRNMNYPMDLATNPKFGHAVQFSIFDYTTDIAPEITNAFKVAGTELANLGNQVTDLAGQVTGSNTTSTDNQTVSQAANSLKNLAVGVAPLMQASTYKQKVKGKSLSTISLYMPDTLQTDYDSNYTSISMTETFGKAGFIANAISDKNFMSKLQQGDIQQIIQSPEGRALLAQIGAGAGGILGANSGNLAGILQQALKVVPNPQMQLIYQGIGLRQFQMEFIFTPISSDEAAVVDNIINAFVYYSVPDVYTGTSGQFLKPPQIFNIKFAFTGATGSLGAISNVFTNTLQNVLGTNATSAILGQTTASQINSSVGENGNAKIFNIGDCVLKNVGVDYAPNGWAAYNDGYPIQTRMTLQFQEMDIVTKQSITKWTGFYDKNLNNNSTNAS